MRDYTPRYCLDIYFTDREDAANNLDVLEVCDDLVLLKQNLEKMINHIDGILEGR
jgi:hypothetical protein